MEEDILIEYIDNSPKYIRGAWLPYWGMEEGLISLEKNISLNMLSPVWYEVNEDGSLKTKIRQSANKIKTLSKQKDIWLVPSIAIFDYEHFSKILNDKENLTRHIQNITDEVLLNNFDGIDIDYESTLLTDKDKYFEFLKRLSNKLHQHNKMLSITVLAKWGDEIKYDTLPQTRKVQDWQRISKYADQIRIMAYDYTFPKSKYPGPIAPNDWVKKVLEYAVKNIPREKIILGVHLYAYEWRNASRDALFFQVDPAKNERVEKMAKAYTYYQVQQILKDHKNSGKLKEFQDENIFEYEIKNNDTEEIEHRLLIFPNEKSIHSKEDLAQEYKIRGIFFWRLGDEDELVL